MIVSGFINRSFQSRYQVAFINAVPNADENERIRMSDSTKRFTKEAVREEDVKFDRVYVIESGKYDVDIVGGKFYNEEKKELAKKEAEAKKPKAVEHKLIAKKDSKKVEKKAEKKVSDFTYVM